MPIKTITIDGIPKGQPRPRFANIGSFVKVYDPSCKIKKEIAKIISEQWVDDIITSPIEMKIVFYMPIPKSLSKKKKKAIIEDDSRHSKKPDIDNLIKMPLDVMNGLVYHDDNQIWRIEGLRIYDENPRTEIILRYGMNEKLKYCYHAIKKWLSSVYEQWKAEE